MSKSYYDLFAGVGLVDYALNDNEWELTLAVDYDSKKKKIFDDNFSADSDKYKLINVYDLRPSDIPNAYLGHASFPCTDVSNAGLRKGVENGEQSSAIDSVLGLLYSKHIEERPKILLTENVKGLLTSNRGQDIRYLLKHYNNLGYSNDLLLIDAKYFVPQSRQRVFVISFMDGILPVGMTQESVAESWFRPKLVIETICKNIDLDWKFLADKNAPKSKLTLSDIVDSSDNSFWNAERADYLFSQMYDKHQQWIRDRRNSQNYHYATAFRRMRHRAGKKQSTAELRTDGLAGCLRTAKGGSAKQILIRVGKGQFNVRLLNEKECSKLMGAPHFTFNKKISLNDYLFAFGDGVCSDVIRWIDCNILTPIYEANLHPNYKKPKNNYIMKSIPVSDEVIRKQFEEWCSAHKDDNYDLPIKGRLFGSLVVLYNLENADSNSAWSYKKSLDVNSTDKGTHFGDRSVRNHTKNKIKLILSQFNRPDLIPNSSTGERGRTSTGTKRAGLDMLQLVNSFTRDVDDQNRKAVGDYVVNLLNELIIEKLDQHAELGGIEVAFNPNHTIASFISKIIEHPGGRSGAVLQHLVGAKLELRYKDNEDVNIEHENSSTADVQTERLGDFDIGNSVIHVTKTPSKGHFEKAYKNAKSGRSTYLLIPDNKLGMASLATDIDKNYTDIVNVFSIEKFISQNLDEISKFQREVSLSTLKNLLLTYNLLIDQYEDDSSLKIVLPDLGV